MNKLEKNIKIKQSLLETKQRREVLDIFCPELKIDESSLSKSTKKNLKELFLQAKWLVNDILSTETPFNYIPTGKVTVKLFNSETRQCDIPVERDITIGSQIQQSIIKQKQRDIINLNKKKRKGFKVGKLKFVKEVKSIDLKQFGVTYKIKGKYVTMQKVGNVKVNGMKQIPPESEIASAKLIKKATGYYLRIVCYIPKKEKVEPIKEEIGIDMGIKTDITLSNGKEYKTSFEIPKQLKKEQQRLSKKTIGSNNYVKQIQNVNKHYERFTNKKNDLVNKIFSELKKHKKIIIQDENLRGWTSWFGKKISTSILGRLKTKVRDFENGWVIDRFLPTTKQCPKCHKFNIISLAQREYRCSCGFHEPRDLKGAKTILCCGIYDQKLNKQFNKKLTRKELMSLPAEVLTSIFSWCYTTKTQVKPSNQEANAL